MIFLDLILSTFPHACHLSTMFYSDSSLDTRMHKTANAVSTSQISKK